jgi:hypothetical protein
MHSKRIRFVAILVGWICALLSAITLLDVFSYELFFVTALVGLLAARELTYTVHVTPPWQRKLRWVTALGFVGFGYILLRNFLQLLPPGLF